VQFLATELIRAFRQAGPFLSPQSQRVRVLDIGCLTGILLDDLQRKSASCYEVLGVEPCRWAAAICRAKGVPVIEGAFESAPVQPSSFDVVTLFDVLGHTVDPRRTLARVRDVLTDEGIVLMTTPDIASGYARLFKRRYWFIESCQLYYFSLKTIRRLLSECGFKVLEIRRHIKILKWPYLVTRLQSIHPVLKCFGRLGRIPFLRHWKIPFYTGQMLVIARKV
jgi:SAM-dependent methyltransferase